MSYMSTAIDFYLSAGHNLQFSLYPDLIIEALAVLPFHYNMHLLL